MSLQFLCECGFFLVDNYVIIETIKHATACVCVNFFETTGCTNVKLGTIDLPPRVSITGEFVTSYSEISFRFCFSSQKKTVSCSNESQLSTFQLEKILLF